MIGAGHGSIGDSAPSLSLLIAINRQSPASPAGDQQFPVTAPRTFIRTRDGTPQPDFATNPATFADVCTCGLAVADPFLRGTGKSPFDHVEQTFKAFTSYRFSKDGPRLLRGGRAGLGANQRGPTVIGYHAANNDAVILTAPHALRSASRPSALPRQCHRSSSPVTPLHR